MTGSNVLSSEELSALWQTHAAALLLVARGHCGTQAPGTAEDCVQEAFISLASQKVQPNNTSAWLMKTVRNAAIDAVRSQQRRVRREQTAASVGRKWLEPVEATLTTESTTDQLKTALQQLDNTTRDIVIAHLWNDMTFRQIADACDVSAATAHRKYEAGIDQLRALMIPHETDTRSSIGTPR